MAVRAALTPPPPRRQIIGAIKPAPNIRGGPSALRVLGEAFGMMGAMRGNRRSGGSYKSRTIAMFFARLGVFGCLLALALGVACGQAPTKTGGQQRLPKMVPGERNCSEGTARFAMGPTAKGRRTGKSASRTACSPRATERDGHTWHHGDGTLFRIVSQGGAIYESPDLPNYKSGMPAFGEKLTRDEIISVINYVKSLWGDKGTGTGSSHHGIAGGSQRDGSISRAKPIGVRYHASGLTLSKWRRGFSIIMRSMVSCFVPNSIR